MTGITERLKRGDIIVGDGALGTLLMERGLKAGESPESVNLNDPQCLEEIASLYIQAGAEIVSTNSFGASTLKLRHFSLEGKVEEINRRAVEAARKAAGSRAYVSGSVGPTSRMLKPYGNTDPGEIYDSFRNQIGILMSAGIDIVCIETMTDLAEAELAVKAAKSLDPAIPVIATVTFEAKPKGFYTLMGSSIQEAAQRLKDSGADIIGSNCGNGSENMVRIAREFMSHTGLPVAIQSNAGLPVRAGEGLVYPETPDFVAARVAEMLDLGVRIVGGCCGTGLDHIRAIRKTVDAYLASAAKHARP
jgi:5-methyltetrahydrofolate--homocysteine methyltransferase